MLEHTTPLTAALNLSVRPDHIAYFFSLPFIRSITYLQTYASFQMLKHVKTNNRTRIAITGKVKGIARKIATIGHLWKEIARNLVACVLVRLNNLG